VREVRHWEKRGGEKNHQGKAQTGIPHRRKGKRTKCMVIIGKDESTNVDKNGGAKRQRDEQGQETDIWRGREIAQGSGESKRRKKHVAARTPAKRVDF